MNPEQIPSSGHASERNEAPISAVEDQRSLYIELEETLSPKACEIIRNLPLVASWSEFEGQVESLNRLKKEEQLNYADPEAAERLEAETLASREWKRTMNFLRGWKLDIERSKNGTYLFTPRLG